MKKIVILHHAVGSHEFTREWFCMTLVLFFLALCIFINSKDVSPNAPLNHLKPTLSGEKDLSIIPPFTVLGGCAIRTILVPYNDGN